MMKEAGKGLESRGLWHYERIGRPDVLFDQRTSYSMKMEEFNKMMEERRKIGRASIATERIGPATIEEEL